MSQALLPDPTTAESARRPDARLCSPKVALALSLLPGLGQVYLGYPRRGLAQLVAVGTLMSILAANLHLSAEPLLTLLLIFTYLHNLIDAYRRAILLNDAIDGLESVPPPTGWGTFPAAGRILASLVLMVGGTMALLHVRFGVSFAWVWDWWPVAFILLGALLLSQALKDRAAEAGARS